MAFRTGWYIHKQPMLFTQQIKCDGLIISGSAALWGVDEMISLDKVKIEWIFWEDSSNILNFDFVSFCITV